MIKEIKASSVDPMVREINKGLMVQWINADLIGRAGYDVRKSMVYLDEDFMFITAVPSGLELSDGQVKVIHDRFGVRYISKGV